jgi:hypothetical protein
MLIDSRTKIRPRPDPAIVPNTNDALPFERLEVLSQFVAKGFIHVRICNEDLDRTLF